MQTPREGIPRRGPHALGRLHVTPPPIRILIVLKNQKRFTVKKLTVRTAVCSQEAKMLYVFFSLYRVFVSQPFQANERVHVILQTYEILSRAYMFKIQESGTVNFAFHCHAFKAKSKLYYC
jgi:hypothetical protein